MLLKDISFQGLCLTPLELLPAKVDALKPFLLEISRAIIFLTWPLPGSLYKFFVPFSSSLKHLLL